MDKVHSRFKKTNRGFVYHYLFSQALPGKPTLLFIHGFPSSSYDWFQQINYLQPLGYGLIVPDLLGYGQTEPKPTDPADYLRDAIALDLIDILDEERVKDVIAIGHDWGTAISSALSVAHSDRFLGFAFVASPYRPPTASPPLNALLEFQRQTSGRPLFGYWTLLFREDAASLIEANVCLSVKMRLRSTHPVDYGKIFNVKIDSLIDMAHPADPEVWKTYMNPPGALEAFIQEKKRLTRASYLTPEHYERIKTSLLQGGLRGPINWYKSTQHEVEDSAKPTLSEEDMKIKKPVFMAVANRDYVSVREFAIAVIEKYTKGGLTIVEFDTGHWPFLEKPGEFNHALHHWVTSTFRLSTNL